MQAGRYLILIRLQIDLFHYSGVWYLHDNNVIHGDIKPQNILLSADKKEVKLCDFGVSRIKASKQATLTCAGNFAGTLDSVAPEMLLKSTRSTRATDLWALGCTLVELFVQEVAWKMTEAGEQDPKEFLKGLMRAKLLPHNLFQLELFNRDIFNRVKELFEYDPVNRPSAEALCKFFSPSDSDEDN